MKDITALPVAEITPLPWRVRVHPADPEEFHVSAKTPPDDPYYGGTAETQILSDESYPRKRADADYIVRACNSYPKMREALQAALDALERSVPMEGFAMPYHKSTIACVQAALSEKEGQ